jgi:thiol:disulfide interchange protein DsbG
MERFGFVDAPLIVWKDQAGKIQLKGSMPRLSEIPKMTGLPQQDIDDPELAKFK